MSAQFLLRSYEPKDIHGRRTGKVVVVCTAVLMLLIQMLLSTAGTASWALALSAIH